LSTDLGRLRSFKGRYKVLHCTWLAFFLTFVVWFNLPPLAGLIRDDLHLKAPQLAILALCNIALTVPARILIGMALDRFGPRRVFSAILIYSLIPCLVCAAATSFNGLIIGRLLASIVGAGFVVGIRIIAEWFTAEEIGTAEGIYGGWGNFGAAGAALSLPIIAVMFGGDGGWRWAMAISGVISAAYGVYYLRAVADTPDGRSYLKPKKAGALEVTSRPAVFGLIGLTVPLAAGLVLVSWRLYHSHVLSDGGFAAACVVVGALLVAQIVMIVRVNRAALAGASPAHGRYPLRAVGVLSGAYFTSFGSEVAMISMLPVYIASHFHVGSVAAGLLAGLYPFMNLTSRPGGGIVSDRARSRRTVLFTVLVSLGLGYGVLAFAGKWPLVAVIVLLVAVAVVVEAGAGATFAIVPLVSRRVTGQISGLVGAYGNLGSLCYLTVLAFFGPVAFFSVMAITALASAVACAALPEYADHGVDDPDLELELLTSSEPVS
jgi:NNP family nitrate/nitrite transporter-like MFS transporter